MSKAPLAPSAVRPGPVLRGPDGRFRKAVPAEGTGQGSLKRLNEVGQGPLRAVVTEGQDSAVAVPDRW